MKTIGLTQRTEFIESHHETRDCLDQKWISLLDTLKLKPIIIPNTLKDPMAYIETLGLDGVILTGGNSSKERDITETTLLKYAEKETLPVLGVCHGMQTINLFCGGYIKRVENHVKIRHSILFENQQLREVNSFHDWGIFKDTLGQSLTVTAVAEDNSIEAFCHTSLPWAGMMWHPERDVIIASEDHQLITDLFQKGYIK